VNRGRRLAARREENAMTVVEAMKAAEKLVTRYGQAKSVGQKDAIAGEYETLMAHHNWIGRPGDDGRAEQLAVRIRDRKLEIERLEGIAKSAAAPSPALFERISVLEGEVTSASKRLARHRAKLAEATAE